MSVRVSRILHAGYIFEHQGVRIVFDPLFENPFSRNCYAYPEIRFDLKEVGKQKFDAIFISHYHDDHCSLESLNLIDRETPIYLFCLFEEMFSLLKELGFKDVHPISLNSPIAVSSFQITARRALDADVDSLFQIRVAGLHILNVVDSWIDDEVLALLMQEGPWDLILWPFQTMREIEVLSPSRVLPPERRLPPEWGEQIRLLRPRWIVPSSCQFRMEAWSWYNQFFFPITYKQFEKEIGEILPATQVWRLNPGATVEINATGIVKTEPLPWIQILGDSDADYHYNEQLKIPSTSQIARKFPALSQKQEEEVRQYCERTLPEKYRALETSDESFFEDKRVWQLSVYDHQGKERNFFYQLEANRATLMAPASESVDWLTEIPISRLYGALKEGESLSSLYIRINDKIFSAAKERALQEADVLEDPLIRCLFTGIGGAYQRAQLARIQKKISLDN